LAVLGPDGYISPDWYGVADQVPTWNYVAVHLTGTLERLPQENLREVLDRQSAHFEEQLRPKAPWRADKMAPEALDRMMRMIVPMQLRIAKVDGTWKLSQNKTEAVRASAATAVTGGIGVELPALAKLMGGA
jgi:transcriptional regulator